MRNLTAAPSYSKRRFKLWDQSHVPFSMRVSGSDAPWIVLFLLPFLIVYTAFTLWPMAATVIYSLYEWNGVRPLAESNFVGLQNYYDVATDGTFQEAFFNTMKFAVINTTIKLPLSFLLAYLLTRNWLWFKRFFRTVFFAPLVVPAAMAGLIFKFLLNPVNGAVNDFLKDIGVIQRSIDFLGDPDLALYSLVLVSVWQIFGQYLIYWMAALSNVPEELYEAAEIDGAGNWQKIRFVTLPVIKPVATVILFLSFVNALKVFGLVVTLTSGGPGNKTNMVAYYIYSQAFQRSPFRYGIASAAALFFGCTVLIAVTIQGYFVRRTQRDAL